MRLSTLLHCELLWLSESDLYFTELYLYLLSCRTEQIWRQMHPQWQNLLQSTSMVSLHSLSFPLSSTCKFLEGITMSSLPVYNSAWSGPLSYSLSKPPPPPLNPDSKHPSFSNTGSVQFSRSAVSDSSQLHEPQHARPPCPSPNSRSPPRPMSIESVMPFNHLILCHPLLLLPSVFPSIRVFSNESALRIRWPKYWSFSFNISPSNEHPGLISFRMD